MTSSSMCRVPQGRQYSRRTAGVKFGLIDAPPPFAVHKRDARLSQDRFEVCEGQQKGQTRTGWVGGQGGGG